MACIIFFKWRYKMQFIKTKHQIGREIFKNIYGRYPENLAYNDNDKKKLDPIRKQVTRTITLFSKLWHNICTNKYEYTYIDKSIAQLIIIEVTFRYTQLSTNKNIKRTKTISYITNQQWHKLDTDSLGVFFYPFFKVIEKEHPNFIKEFKSTFYNNNSIDNRIFLYIKQLRELFV